MEISKERCVGMKQLKKLWNDKHFQFFEEYYHTELHSKLRTENHKYYHVYDDNIKNLLEKYKPLHNEFVLTTIDNLSGSYSSFKGSPASEGILQFDMWNVTPSDRYNWNKLKMILKITD